MTGFGRGQAEGNGYAVQVDLRSLNHRFLEVHVRGLADSPLLAQRCEELLRPGFARGDLELTVQWKFTGEAQPRQLNLAAAKRYFADLSTLRDELGIEEPPGLSHLLVLGVFQDWRPDEEALWSPLAQAVAEAMAAVGTARAAEGKKLKAALKKEEETLASLISRAEELAPVALAEAERRLRERLALAISAEPGPLPAELALWVERGDVQEELARLAAHLARLRELEDMAGPVGRELEFLAQEIGREAATLAAKARSTALGQTALAMRLAAERIREQAKNAE